MGSKYKGYCSDITCTFPVNGKFSEKQRYVPPESPSSHASE